MKELKNRIKGLSAILLAVSLALCLVVRFSGANVSANIADVITIDASATDSITGNGYSVKYAIDNKIVTSSLSITGGTFVLVGNNDIIKSNITYDNGADNGASDTASHYKAELSGTYYAGFMITGAEKFSSDPLIYHFTVQFVKEPEFASGSAGTIGVGTYFLTRENAYSFSGEGTYKVQGDPTVYQFKEFCVPSDGTYTILQ